MTNAEQIYEHLKRLPESVVTEVLDFVQFLEHKRASEGVSVKTSVKRHPGTARGQVWMAADFDAPLDDFNWS
jgi:restriction endonuclease Mrr